jgi:hypothetical protein
MADEISFANPVNDVTPASPGDGGEGGGDGKAAVHPVRAFLDSKPYTVWIVLLTGFSILSNDLRILVFTKEDDFAFGVLVLVVVLFWAFEIVANLALGRGYSTTNLTVFFWVDVLGTFTLLPDVINLLGGNSTSGGQLNMARAARAARLGGRLSLMIRAVRYPDEKRSVGGKTSDETMDSKVS